MIDLAYKSIDIDSWYRKDIFHYFMTCDEPFHGVTVMLDVTKTKAFCKQENISIFHRYMFHYLNAINNSKAMKLRLIDQKPVEFERISSGITVAKEDGSFAYGLLEQMPNFEIFSKQMVHEIERVKNRGTLKDQENRIDIIHFSVLPWTNFISLSHSRRYNTDDSVPKITFGKITETDGKWSMPISIHVHHSLVDGRDVAEFIDDLQELLDE